RAASSPPSPAARPATSGPSHGRRSGASRAGSASTSATPSSARRGSASSGAGRRRRAGPPPTTPPRRGTGPASRRSWSTRSWLPTTTDPAPATRRGRSLLPEELDEAGPAEGGSDQDCGGPDGEEPDREDEQHAGRRHGQVR